MQKEDSDKIKKLFDEIQAVTDKISNLTLIGSYKNITKLGNSSHIIMGKNDIGKRAFVIILPNFEKL